MLTPDLQEIKFYLSSKDGSPIDDRIFDEYHDAEFALDNLILLNESAFNQVNISSYKVKKTFLTE